MKLFHGAQLDETESWSGPNVAEVEGAAVKLRWTKDPYVWHRNTGDEVFVVLDGHVDMHVRENGQERVVPLTTGDVFHFADGDEHVAHPRGVARLLVIESPHSD